MWLLSEKRGPWRASQTRRKIGDQYKKKKKTQTLLSQRGFNRDASGKIAAGEVDYSRKRVDHKQREKKKSPTGKTEGGGTPNYRLGGRGRYHLGRKKKKSGTQRALRNNLEGNCEQLRGWTIFSFELNSRAPPHRDQNMGGGLLSQMGECEQGERHISLAVPQGKFFTRGGDRSHGPLKGESWGSEGLKQSRGKRVNNSHNPRGTVGQEESQGEETHVVSVVRGRRSKAEKS